MLVGGNGYGNGSPFFGVAKGEEMGSRFVDERHQYSLENFNVGDSWRLFRIMSEFVDGFDTLSSVQKPAVSFLGSARRTLLQAGRPDRHRPCRGRLRHYYRRRTRDHGGGQ